MEKLARILLPLDGSETSERAIPVAETLARRTGATLVLVRAAYAQTFPGVDPSESQLRAVGEAEAYLDSVEARLRRSAIAVEKAVPYGPAAESLIMEIDLRRPDLLVMSTHGRSGVSRLAFGSVAMDLVRSSTIPVLLVRSGATWSNVPASRIHVLVALDGSPVGEAGVGPAADLVRLLGGRITLVQVLRPHEQGVPPTAVGPRPSSSTGMAQARSAATDYLGEVCGRPELRGLEVAALVLEGPAGPAIAQAATGQNADLIALATHGRSGLARMVLGSVAESVVVGAELPVLVVRPAALGSSTDAGSH